jgi:hypothetical protein
MPSYEVNFVCPKCGCEQLEEKVEGIIIFYELLSLYHDEESGTIIGEDYGDSEENHDFSEVAGYMCQECGYLVGENSYEALAWLKENNMLTELFFTKG